MADLEGCSCGIRTSAFLSGIDFYLSPPQTRVHQIFFLPLKILSVLGDPVRLGDIQLRNSSLEPAVTIRALFRFPSARPNVME